VRLLILQLLAAPFQNVRLNARIDLLIDAAGLIRMRVLFASPERGHGDAQTRERLVDTR